MITSEAKLEYFISEKKDYLVISLVGTIARGTLPILEKVQLDVNKSEAKQVILNFHDLTRIEVGGIPGIVRLQKQIRDRSSTHLRLCFLKPDIYKLLVEAGAVRPNEISANLLNALKDLNEFVVNPREIHKPSEVRKAA